MRRVERRVTAVRNAQFQVATDVLASWREDLLTGNPPTLFPIGTGGLAQIEIGPGLVALLGGAPGAGKTAFTMQCLIDALRLTPTLRAVVCNVEMPPNVLLDRQLARISGIDLSVIRHRQFADEHADRIDQALATLEPLAERLAFVRPPFDLANVALTADAFGADLLLLDYIQRIGPHGEHADKRGEVNSTMDFLRQFADNGSAVIVVSAVGRTRDARGRSSYSGEGLNLASFRESSELEFGCDDAFILTPDKRADDVVTLRHLKSRHGQQQDLELNFHRRVQRFEAAESEEATSQPNGELRSALAALWSQTPPAGNDEGVDDT